MTVSQVVAKTAFASFPCHHVPSICLRRLLSHLGVRSKIVMDKMKAFPRFYAFIVVDPSKVMPLMTNYLHLVHFELTLFQFLEKHLKRRYCFYGDCVNASLEIAIITSHSECSSENRRGSDGGGRRRKRKYPVWKWESISGPMFQERSIEEIYDLLTPKDHVIVVKLVRS